MNSLAKQCPLFRIALILTAFCLLAGCSGSTGPDDPNSDIPPDPSNIVVPAPTANNLKPTATFAKTAGNASRIRLSLLGLLDPTNNYQPIEFRANENLFVTEDGVVQGMLVRRVDVSNVLAADVIFSVDNSGSMAQEADSVAASIAEFAVFLAGSGLDVLFGIVGYNDGGNVVGAINLTTASRIDAYLNGRNLRGTLRTRGFAGSDSVQLLSSANGYASSVRGENGVVGIFFAEQHFSFRPGAQRIYINFTDEPTQPGGHFAWSTDSLCNALSGQATVHTVWSGGDTTFFAEAPLAAEKPWRMSECTGGTIKLAPANATGLSLVDLPVSGALANSYLVEFVTDNPNGSHTIVITVKKSNAADGQTVYRDVVY